MLGGHEGSEHRGLFNKMQLMAFPSFAPPKQFTCSSHISIKPGLSSKSKFLLNPVFKSISQPTSRKVPASVSHVAADLDGEAEHLQKLPAGLKEELMPKHVAVIMDGNRRWAVDRGQPSTAGHQAGRTALKSLLRLCSKFGIKVVTVFAFSTENWNRPIEEVEFLMDLFEEAMRIDLEEFLSHGMQLTIMGNRSMMSSSLQELFRQSEERSKDNSGTHVNFAINYSGKYDITQACKSIAKKVKDCVILPQDINDGVFEKELGTKLVEFPSVDLLIRTSGEIRLSNFMLWQMAYSELYFVNKFFPDFEENDLIKALCVYQKRRRV